MGKTTVSLYIPKKLVEEAHKINLNLPKILEKALIQRNKPFFSA